MKKLFKKIREALKFVPKQAALAFGVLAIVGIGATALAWGPAERPTFTIEKPATYVTFNSITNNPGIGDERNFVGARDMASSSSIWSANSIAVQENHEYMVRMYVHNNAADSLKLTATGVTAKFSLPSGSGTNLTIGGTLSSTNATPNTYWDEVSFTNSKEFNLVYVPGSANWATNGAAAGKLSDALVGSGVLLGYNALNGQIPGCFQYDGYVTFRVRPEFKPNFDYSVSKKVSKHDASNWVENYNAKPGEVVDFQITYTNVSGERQDNVMIKDILPAGLNSSNVTFSEWLNLNTGQWQTSVADITTTGINIGSYIGKGTNTRAEIGVRMPSAAELECGVNYFNNIGRVTVNGTYKTDDATVTITKDCPPPEKVFTCDALNINKINRTSFGFTTAYTVQNTTFQKIRYTISGNGVYDIYESTATNGAFTYTQTQPGTYTVTATLYTADGTATSAACQKQITVDPEPVTPEYTCKLLTANRVNIKAGESVAFTITPEYRGDVQVAGTYMDFGDGMVTSPANTLNYSHIYTTPGTYKAKAYINFIVEGAQRNNVTSVACEQTITVTEAPTPEFVCDRLFISKLSRTQFQFATVYTINNTNFVNISYTITGAGVNDTRVSTDTLGRVVYNQTKPGTYRVVATLNTSDGSNTNINCEGEITVEADPDPSEAICQLLTADKLTAKPGEAVNFRVYPWTRGNVSIVGAYVDFGDGLQSPLLTTSPYTTSHAYATAGTYKAKAYVNFFVDGIFRGNVSSVECEQTIIVEADPDPDPEFVCNHLNITQVTRTHFQFTTDYVVQNTTFQNITYVITGNGVNDTLVSTATNGYRVYNQTKPGVYRVVATLNTSDGSSTTLGCEGEIEVVEVPEGNCKIPGKEHLPVNHPDCKEDDKHCKVPGKEHLPINHPDCREDWCKVPGKEHLKPEDPNCVSNTGGGDGPSYLPKTGLEAFGLLGLGSMTTAGAYYVASRRNLRKD